MSNKSFFAANWFKKGPDSLVESDQIHIQNLSKNYVYSSELLRFPKFTKAPQKMPAPPLQSHKFYPFHCFIPGWSGESLLSKNIIQLESILRILKDDIKNELLKSSYFPRSIKQGVFSEFLSYANSHHLNFEGLCDLKTFWSSIYSLNVYSAKNSGPDESPEIISLNDFLDIYCFRVATIILLKLKFISHLIESCDFEINEKAILYPSAYLSQIFKKELNEDFFAYRNKKRIKRSKK